MCEPTTATMAIISTVATVGGAALQFMGSQSAAASAKAQADYQAAVARNNQIYAEQAAKDTEQRAQVAEMNSRNAAKKLIGRQRAVLAANGVLVDEGSALDITSDTAGLGEIDALTIRSNAEREAIGYRNQGANFGGEAALAAARSSNASQAAFFNGASSLLTGAGGVAQKWYSYNKELGSGWMGRGVSGFGLG